MTAQVDLKFDSEGNARPGSITLSPAEWQIILDWIDCVRDHGATRQLSDEEEALALRIAALVL